jgi:hypothetical protein
LGVLGGGSEQEASMFRREARREELFHMERRRRRRRLMVGGAVVVGSTEAMVKLSEPEAQQIQQATGKNPEEMSHEELQQSMQQQGIAGQPVTAADQQAMATAEAADPDGTAPAAAAPATAVAAAAPAAPPAAPPAPAPAPAPSEAAALAEMTAEQFAELEKLGQLHTEGVLTDAELAAAKAKVLGL